MSIYAPTKNSSSSHTKRLFLFLIALFGLAASALTIPVLAASVATNPAMQASLIINEVQTSGCSAGDITSSCTEDAKKEFIELYNPQSTSIQADNWHVQYVTASGSTTTTLVNLDGKIAGHETVLLAHTGYYDSADLFFGANSDSGKLAKSGGNIQITDSRNLVIDRLGWGSAVKSNDWPVIAEIKPGYSSKRVLPGDTGYVNVLQYTVPSSLVSPRGGGYTPTPVPTPVPAQSLPISEPAVTEVPQSITLPETTTPTLPATDCLDIQLSELLPNPAGTDTGQEFIELHNPTDQALSLQGCSLKTSASTKVYSFPSGTMLQPDEYHAFSDETTGLSLANAAGGTVTFSTPAGVVLQALAYPEDMKDDQVWAFINGGWQALSSPSPNSVNLPDPVLVQPTELGPTIMSSSSATLVPCKEGQVRNLDTNRCRNVASVASSGVVACKPGQERNPETNRCKSITSTTTTPAQCKPGQTRNPETNRCKSAADANTAPKACQAGQIRNPATNRCKKGTSLATTTGVKDIKAAAGSGGASHWLVITIALAAALAYAAYEWRHEIYVKFRLNRITAKLPNFKPYSLNTAKPLSDIKT